MSGVLDKNAIPLAWLNTVFSPFPHSSSFLKFSLLKNTRKFRFGNSVGDVCDEHWQSSNDHYEQFQHLVRNFAAAKKTIKRDANNTSATLSSSCVQFRSI